MSLNPTRHQSEHTNADIAFHISIYQAEYESNLYWIRQFNGQLGLQTNHISRNSDIRNRLADLMGSYAAVDEWITMKILAI